MITCVFFASIREAMGADRLQIDAGGIGNVCDVIRTLTAGDDRRAEALERENLLVAVNQTMVDPAHQVEDGDEVAFFPPVTGG